MKVFLVIESEAYCGDEVVAVYRIQGEADAAVAKWYAEKDRWCTSRLVEEYEVI